nr:hypothetical protein [Tanacetum cinerariifolium]
MVPLGYKPFDSHIKLKDCHKCMDYVFNAELRPTYTYWKLFKGFTVQFLPVLHYGRFVLPSITKFAVNSLQLTRKQTGSLAVCDLFNIVTPYDIVPRSSKNLHEDNEYALYTVTLLKRDADNFRTKARKRGFQIRDIEYNSETQESQKQELKNLMQDQESTRSSLLQWCYTSYGERFSLPECTFVFVYFSRAF